MAPGDPAVYEDALAEVTAYLDMWRDKGLTAAIDEFFPGIKTGPDTDELPLLTATIVSYKPSRWASSDNFTLRVTIDMRFPGGDGGAFGDGPNTRFITFTRSPSGHPFLMQWATSP